ncbi:MAG: hypothetical protein HQK73_10650 [Desulfamplus sp.]|nr:hypothetical protein [Desulfamplus sp.]
MIFDHKARKKLFFCSLALFIISLVYRILNPFTQPTVKELTYKAKQSVPHNSGSIANYDRDGILDAEIRLHTELFFNQNAVSTARATKDIFYKPLPLLENSEKEYPVKINTPEPEISADEDVEPESDKDIKERERASALSGIVEELLHIRVIGGSKTEGKLSFFIKDGDNVLLISRGSKIKGLYPVTALTQDYILIKIPEFNEDVRINLKDFNENRYL